MISFNSIKTTKVILLATPIVPVSIKQSWFDMRLFNNPYNTFKLEDFSYIEEIKHNTAKIHKIIDQEIKELGDSRKIIIGGISQGCAMALYAGLSYHKPLGGIVGIAGFFLPFTHVHQANERTPIFIGHGQQDNIVPVSMAALSYALLDFTKHKLIVRLEPFLGHSINQNLCLEIKRFLGNVFDQTKTQN